MQQDAPTKKPPAGRLFSWSTLRRYAAFCCSSARRAIQACEPNTPCSSAGRVLTCATRRKTIHRPSIPCKLIMRDAAINIRALPAQRAIIDRAASALGKTRSDFMLDAACERAQSVLLDQTFITLDTESFDEFLALLDAPPAPNPGLERLMAVKAPWDKEGGA